MALVKPHKQQVAQAAQLQLCLHFSILRTILQAILLQAKFPRQMFPVRTLILPLLRSLGQVNLFPLHLAPVHVQRLHHHR